MSNSSSSNNNSADATSVSWLPTSIPWVDCFKDEGAMYNVTWQCANLTVPIDYRSTKNSTTQVGVVRGRPNELEKPLGALFSNRGGPSGAMIMPYASSGAKSYFKVTNRQYDVLLIDPRGTGWSQHMTCGFTTESYSAFNNASSGALTALQLPGNPLKKDSLTENVEMYAAQAGSFCSEFENKDYLAHMNTPNVVRDFDLIRNLTGYETLDYWGFSYGTVVGAMYAHMYPDRVGKMVLDGVCDFAKWTSPTGNILDYSYNSHSEIPRVLGDFANHCVAAAQVDVRYCQLANKSLNASNPGADVFQRMNYVIGNLTTNTYKDNTANTTVSLFSIANVIRQGLMGTQYFPSLAQYFLDAETLIQNQQPTNAVNEAAQIEDNPTPTDPSTDASTNTTISTINWNPNDPLTGESNAFVFPAVTCLDMSIAGINTTETFVDYISNQINNGSALVGYEGISFAMCLSWPNLSSFDVERVTSDFPKTLKNKILVVGVTNDPVTPYPDAMATYNMIGSNNANFMVHDGFGHCTTADPNNCTWSNLINFFVNGTIPANGTTCVTDNSGANNLFIENYQHPASSGSSGGLSEGAKIGLGVGLGVGIPLLIGLCVLFAMLMRRRSRARQASAGSAGSQPMAENKIEQESVMSGTNEAVI